MTGKLGKFYVDCDIHGARVLATSHNLTPGCLGGEIDAYIQLLKDDLDACGREMKRKVSAMDRKALFERQHSNA